MAGIDLIIASVEAPIDLGVVEADEPIDLDVGAAPPRIDWYPGPYVVTPRIASQELETADLAMREDVTVEGIPWWETSNPYGKTYVIGE